MSEIPESRVESVARAMWIARLKLAGESEESAIAICGDDWHQYLPEANAAMSVINEDLTAIADHLEHEATDMKRGNVRWIGGVDALRITASTLRDYVAGSES